MDLLRAECLKHLASNISSVMKDAYHLNDCKEEVPYDQIEDNVYDELMTLVSLDTDSLIKLIKVEN